MVFPDMNLIGHLAIIGLLYPHIHVVYIINLTQGFDDHTNYDHNMWNYIFILEID